MNDIKPRIQRLGVCGPAHLHLQIGPDEDLPRTTHSPTPPSSRALAPRDSESRSRRVGGQASLLGGRTYRVACSLPRGLVALQVYCCPGWMSGSWLTLWCWEGEPWPGGRPTSSPSSRWSGETHWMSGRGDPSTSHSALKPESSLPWTDRDRIRGGAGKGKKEAFKRTVVGTTLMNHVSEDPDG